MLPLETLGAFFVTAIVMGLAPGPDNIFVLTQSALYGFRAGIVTTLGLMTGLFGHTAAVALGVAALFQTSEMAFTVLKCAGAAYLLYLAWLSFRSGASRAWLEQSTFPGYWALYRRGVIMNITNRHAFSFSPSSHSSKPELGNVPLQIVTLASSSSSLRWPSSEAFHSLAAGLPNGSTLPSEARSSSTGSPPASSPHWHSCLSSLPDDKKPRHAGLFFFVALN
ncbi:MAG: LysE family translocator [Bilophila wadsworthia]